jgi:hypothetical protein
VETAPTGPAAGPMETPALMACASSSAATPAPSAPGSTVPAATLSPASQSDQTTVHDIIWHKIFSFQFGSNIWSQLHGPNFVKIPSYLDFVGVPASLNDEVTVLRDYRFTTDQCPIQKLVHPDWRTNSSGTLLHKFMNALNQVMRPLEWLESLTRLLQMCSSMSHSSFRPLSLAKSTTTTKQRKGKIVL